MPHVRIYAGGGGRGAIPVPTATTELYGWLQHPMAAAGDCPSRPGRAPLRPVGRDRVRGWLVAGDVGAGQHTGFARHINSQPGALARPCGVLGGWMNSAVPTTKTSER